MSSRRFLARALIALGLTMLLTRGVRAEMVLEVSPPGPVTGTSITPVATASVNMADLARQQALHPLGVPAVRVLMREFDDAESEDIVYPKVGTPQADVVAPPRMGPLVASPGPTNSFIGLDDIPMADSSYIVIPPDVHGAVGLTKVMDTHNNNYRIQNKATGAVLTTVGTATFWNPVITNKTLLSALTDPHVEYDPINNRWITVMQTIAATAANTQVLIAVSQTSDPSGAWFEYAFANLAGATNIQVDFPSVGFNKNWIDVAINRYTTGGSFSEGIDVVVSYPAAMAGTLSSGTIFTQSGGSHFCHSPCVTYSATEDTLFLVDVITPASAVYLVDRITGTPTAPVYTVGTNATRPGGGWNTNATANRMPQSAPNAGASICGATPCPIEIQDTEVRSEPIYRVDSTTGRGFVYFSQTVGLPSGGTPTHTAAQWTKITPSSSAPVFADGGRIEDPTATLSNTGKHYDNVHMAVNSLGDMIIGFTQFATNQHPSAGYAYRDHNDAPGTFRDPIVYKAGEDYYHKTFTTNTGRNRWGDFSKAQVDPSDDKSLWVYQEYPKTRATTDDGTTGSNASKWSNYWADLQLYSIQASAGPNGTIAPSGTTTVPSGGSQTYTITPNACYSVASVTVDGNSVGAVTSYTFTNVTANHTISATFSQNAFTIAASAGAGGSISPSGSVIVLCGNNQTFNINAADACHAIQDVVVDGVSRGAVASYTFTNVQAAHTITASFSTLGPYTINASADPNGSISPSGAVSVACGNNQSFSVTPNSGYYIQDVLVDGGSVGAVASYTFTNVHTNHSIAASFALDVSTIGAQSTTSVICPTNTCVTVPVTLTRHGGTGVLGYSVTFQLGGGLTLCSGTASVTEGPFLSSVGPTTFQVVDNGGGSYTADGAIFANCGPTGSGTLFNIGVSSSSPSGPGTITVTALKLRDCSNADLATAIGPPATVPVDNQAPVVMVTSPNGGESWTIGTSQNITWTATDNVGVANVDIAYSTDGGATYPNVVATAIANSGSYAWTVPAPATNQARVRVTAHDVNCSSASDASDQDFSIVPATRTILASAGAGGSISPSGAVVVPFGGNQTFAIAGDGCHSIADVVVDGVSRGVVSSYTFNNVTVDHTISATFSLNTYTIVASAGAGGSITPNGNVSVNCGDNASFSIAADGCHTIADVVVDGSSVGAVASYTFNSVNANHTITASFSLNTYTIVASAGAGGSITPSGNVSVNCGSDQSFAIAGDGCHSIADVVVDGSSVGAVASYTFNNVTANHTITASFSLNSYTIVASAGGGGSITPSGNVAVSCGSDQSFSIAADGCHTIADVVVDGSSVGAVSSYTFNNVTANHTITASFTLTNYTIVASAGPNGSISPSGNVSVGCGSNQTFSISPASCYAIADVQVDGGSVGAVSSYTFSNVTANHTIAASFLALHVHDVNTGMCFATIQGAINDPTTLPGHTIVVDPGTYTENVNLTKALILKGNQAGVPACGRSATETIVLAANPAVPVLTIPGGAGIVIDGFTFDQNNGNPGGTSAAVFQSSATTTLQFKNNRIVNFKTQAMWFQRASTDMIIDGNSMDGSGEAGASQTLFLSTNTYAGLHLTNNCITNGTGAGWFVDGVRNVGTGASNPVVSGNTFSNNAGVGVNAGSRSLDNATISNNTFANNAFDGFQGGPSNTSITGNHFTNNGRHGLALTSFGSTGAGRGSINVTVTGNYITGNGFAQAGSGYLLSSPQPAGNAASCHANHNDIVGNATGASYAATEVFDVGCNWWGDINGPNYSPTNVNPPGDKLVASNPTFSPWLDGSISGSPNCDQVIKHTILATAGPNGTITPSGSVIVPDGGSQTFSIAGDACHAIADVVVDGVSRGAVSSYTFTNVTTNHTITASFSLNGYTIVASAGPGGSITPSGNVSVNCGDNQSFTIAGDGCHSIADVVVDGSSVGATASYTFTNVTANHTITASFSLNSYTIVASAGAGGSITPSGNVSVNCGSDQSFSIAGDACHTVADVVVDGSSVGATASYTFTNVTANHTISATFALTSYAIQASAGTGGTINPNGVVPVNCGASQTFSIAASACYHIADVVVDGGSVGAVASYTFANVTANHTIAASFASNASTAGAVTALTATQVKSGNDADGTTKITLTFTAPGGAASVEVWRKGFGSYPTYDDGGGSVPPTPGSYPPAGWTLTSVTASGQTDEPATRDFWYYVAYAKDACGAAGPVSNETSGTLNYHLGDVTDGTTPGQGDNVVSTADISLLGAHYGDSGAALAGFEYLDVGPTTDSSTNGRPTTDDRADFEDLVMFAINYTPRVSALASKLAPGATTANFVSVSRPTGVVMGQDFDVQVDVSGGGNLQALSLSLQWNAAVAVPTGVTTGDFVTQQQGVMFSPGAGRLDAALLGVGAGMTGQGTFGVVHFHAVGLGDPAIRIEHVQGRDAANHAVAVAIGTPLGVAGAVTATDLEPVIPNPARGQALMQYSLVKSGPVDLSVYSVDGRRVRTLAHGVMEAGRHQVVWNGSDERGAGLGAGVYFVRLEAMGVLKTRIMTLIR